MPLTRAQIVDTAFEMLREGGLASLSMRRLAGELGVQPGALYYHLASKQELLAAVAERILAGQDPALAASDPRRGALELRKALLGVRDGAEVVSFVHAFRPSSLTALGGLRAHFAERLRAREADWAADTLLHYVLGYVADEQNHAELVRAKVLPGTGTRASRERFLFGVDAILSGLAAKAGAERGGGRSGA
jgi:AcrR family transcriptional regulator